ncbi:hypothetical protein BDD39_003243 [Saccharococcus thermophilus]|uniref:Uncharacterized protein n=1 Tax=Saccharococcus thermophilus TaxID=29396 RepID=A0A846MLU6_9BACL|nr:hypothetical protein [Saccharococcus thermophilus]
MFDSLDIHGDYTWEEILTYTKVQKQRMNGLKVLAGWIQL